MSKSAVASILSSLVDWVRPDAPGEQPLTTQVARDIVTHERFSSLLSYRDEIEDMRLIMLDDGAPAVGFMLILSPLVVAGSAAEPHLEGIIKVCPANTVLQYGVMSMPQVGGFLHSWLESRLAKNPPPLMRQMAIRRYEFMRAAATDFSLIPGSRMHPRQQYFLLSVRVPFTGNPANEKEVNLFFDDVVELRNAIRGGLKATRIDSEALPGAAVKFFLRELLNPHLAPDDRLTTNTPGVPMHKDLLDRRTRLTVQPGGRIGFALDSDANPAIVAVPMTVDVMPDQLHLNRTCRVLGAPESYEDRIAMPFYAYTNIHVLDRERSNDEMVMKLGLLNRQTMSGSEWYRSMMSHLYKRRDHVHKLNELTSNGARQIRAYSGINLYCHPDEARQAAETVKGLWQNEDFRLEIEPHITLPAFVASLPLQYSPTMDPPNGGLQRATRCHSLNGAALSLVQGDWSGTGPERGGPLLVSRRGQLCTIDLLKSTTNMNFVVVATSGAGKSVFANEIVSDFLSKGGMARIIDVGGSYARYCEVNNGVNMTFDPEDPKSLNPLWGIETEDQLNELMPLMQDLLRQMAYPLREDAPDWEYSLLPRAVEAAWREFGARTEMRHVYDWLRTHPDRRANDLADMLTGYAVGRLSKWFNGPRQIAFEGPLVVLELERLNNDKELRSVVLALAIHSITRELYLADRALPKLLAIDEAWDLLGGAGTGKFIETAFRRIRKYNGIAGIITQSFADFERTPAAKAALENAAWKFMLFQKGDSINAAIRNGWMQEGSYEAELLKTVRPGDGFSEILVQGESGTGLYRLVLDRHSYYTFTTKATEIAAINNLIGNGKTMAEAIDEMAYLDYVSRFGTEQANKICGRGRHAA